MERKTIICECDSLTHQIIFSKFTNDEDKTIYVDFYLPRTKGFFKRLKIAFRYLVSGNSQYGDPFEEIILGPEKTKELIEFCKHGQN